MSYPTKVSFKGQVTIPKRVREKLSLSPGDFVLFEERKGEVLLKKARLSPEGEFEKLAEAVGRKARKLGITDEDIEEAIRWARKK